MYPRIRLPINYRSMSSLIAAILIQEPRFTRGNAVSDVVPEYLIYSYVVIRSIPNVIRICIHALFCQVPVYNIPCRYNTVWRYNLDPEMQVLRSRPCPTIHVVF